MEQHQRAIAVHQQSEPQSSSSSLYEPLISRLHKPLSVSVHKVLSFNQIE